MFYRTDLQIFQIAVDVLEFIRYVALCCVFDVVVSAELLSHPCTAQTCSRLPILLSASLHTGHVQTKSKAWGVSNAINTKGTTVLCQVA